MRTLNVRPRQSSLDSADEGFRYAVLKGNRPKTAQVSTNGKNVTLGQFGICDGFSTKSLMATFPHLIVNIVLRRSKEQMRKINAGWRVTSVANLHSLWNGTVCGRPNKTSYSPRSAFIPKLSISSIIGSPLPESATAFVGRPGKSCKAHLPRDWTRVFCGHLQSLRIAVASQGRDWRLRAARPALYSARTA